MWGSEKLRDAIDGVGGGAVAAARPPSALLLYYRYATRASPHSHLPSPFGLRCERASSTARGERCACARVRARVRVCVRARVRARERRAVKAQMAVQSHALSVGVLLRLRLRHPQHPPTQPCPHVCSDTRSVKDRGLRLDGGDGGTHVSHQGLLLGEARAN